MIARKVLVIARTAGLVRDVQAAGGAGLVVSHHTSVGDVEEFVELKGPFDALVAGPLFDSRSGMERLRRLRGSYPDLPVLLALPSAMRAPVPEIVRVGAADLVELPAERKVLAAALRRTLDSVGVAAEGDDLESGDPSLGEVITVASPSGGCGKTFYSTNLAYFLSQRSGRRVCLVDLDLQFGEVMSALRLKPRYTMIDAVAGSEEHDVDLESTIEDFLVPHDTGFWVLAAPRHPAEADRIGLPDITRIIEALRHNFDYVVVDTSAQLSEVTLTALEHSTTLICMATVDVPCIRNMRVFLDTLERLRVSTDQVSVVLNKVESDIGITLEEVDEALHHKVSAVLPYAREVSRSINQGQPVLASAARSEIARKLVTSMQSRLGPTASADPGQLDPSPRWAPRLTGADDRSPGKPRRLFGVFSRSTEGR